MRIKLCAFADEAGSSLSQQIQALKRNAITLVELRSVDGINVAKLTVDQAVRIKSELDANGISVFSLGSPIGKIGINEDFLGHLQVFEHLLCLAKVFECARIRMFSFFTNAYEAVKTQVFERLTTLAGIAERKGVVLFHENEKDIYGDTVDRVLQILDNVPSLGCIYDPANFVQSGENIDYALDKVLPRVDYLHIKDVLQATGELVPAGYGDCQIAKTISRLQKDCVATIEPHLRVFEGYSQIDSTKLKVKFAYATASEAFDAACEAFKAILKTLNFKYKDGDYVL